MKALQITEFGTTPRLVDVPEPTPGPGEVRLRVSAVALNFADLLLIEGRYQVRPTTPFAPGLEVCGVVDVVGPGVADVVVGERLAGLPPWGGLAEAVVLPATACWRPPVGMSDDMSAAVQIAHGTSHVALLHRGRLERGETVVVLGAGGGVGLAAVEIGAATGARVIALARGADKCAVARAAGATETIDSGSTENVTDALRELGRADIVYDPVGGALGRAAFRALRPEGRHLVIGFASGELPELPLNHVMVKNIDVIGVHWRAYLDHAPRVVHDSLVQLSTWIVDGRLRPRIDDVLPLDRALEGLERLKRRDVTGKVVVRP